MRHDRLAAHGYAGALGEAHTGRQDGAVEAILGVGGFKQTAPCPVNHIGPQAQLMRARFDFF